MHCCTFVTSSSYWCLLNFEGHSATNMFYLLRYLVPVTSWQSYHIFFCMYIYVNQTRTTNSINQLKFWMNFKHTNLLMLSDFKFIYAIIFFKGVTWHVMKYQYHGTNCIIKSTIVCYLFLLVISFIIILKLIHVTKYLFFWILFVLEFDVITTIQRSNFT